MGRAANPGVPGVPGDGSGRLLASRYRLTGRQVATGVAAVDTRSGAAVQLDAVPLPELVTPFDQDRQPVRGDDTAERALVQAAFVAGAVPDHPRLSQVFQVFDEDGYLWVAGEAVPGAPLGAVLERGGPLGPYRAAELAGDLVAALRAVHAVGLVHGNVTADTVLVCDDGTALLGGLAVGAAQEALCGGPGGDTPGAGVPSSPWSPARVRARDARAVVVGEAPERWAPEQRGPGGPAGAVAAVGPAADAWALGALLHRALTGEPLPGADPETPLDALPEAAREPAEAVSGPLGPLVGRLLAADPQARPSLPEVQQEIRELLLRAPEPVNQEAVLAVAALLPGPRRTELPGRSDRAAAADRAVVARQDAHHHAAPRRHAGRLGVVLVTAILLIVTSALVMAALIGK
ncbi:hypothetical protein GXW83_29820 [Streptacidiphilus sp. PB12-B1b]|uniref:hypothetical protein n=1 Tax=Streptacidiphilus sp. PB12-B1b TaxID=2705012 RepID=UPI0015FA6411|nr:hypothetical protein [Streptacidiphilus sp. PB12-B1b]QMU79281.1 hypothetical protein GXW83_29820 [Streptacidiphilus sp. PB12-B1b]